MKSRQQNYRMQNAKIQTRQDICGMKKTKYRKLITYQQNAGKDRALRQHTEGRPRIQENLIVEFKTRKYSRKTSLKL